MQCEGILSALIGLVGATNNNGTTDQTDDIVRAALLADADSEEMITCIHKEKFLIAPNCASCTAPCGNTSDYDMTRFADTESETLNAKLAVIDALRVLAAKGGKLPQAVYTAISYLGYELDMESYLDILEELKL